LNEVNELCDPADLEVYGATHGLSRDHAVDFSELARKVIEGRSFRPAIKLSQGLGDKFRTHWRQNPLDR
jgi:hypothetical protein